MRFGRSVLAGVGGLVGSVVQVVQPGYMIGERVLRPALVGVSKGGPKTAPVSAPNDNAKAST